MYNYTNIRDCKDLINKLKGGHYDYLYCVIERH